MVYAQMEHGQCTGLFGKVKTTGATVVVRYTTTGATDQFFARSKNSFGNSS